MAAAQAALRVCVDNNIFPFLLPYTFPNARANRTLRNNIERLHLRNVNWGRECGVCDRADWKTFVFVCDDEHEKPVMYVCVLCKSGFWPSEADIEHPAAAHVVVHVPVYFTESEEEFSVHAEYDSEEDVFGHGLRPG